MSRHYLRNFGLPAIVLATLYVACADPPKKANTGGGGSPGTAGMMEGDAGETASGGSHANGGKGGGGAAGGGMSDAGEGGMGEGGEAGAAEPSGGSGGSGGKGGSSGSLGGSGGSGGSLPAACQFLTIGKSKMPAPPTTGVAKPAGAVGNFNVINWAGFKGALSYTFDDSLQNQVTHYEDLNAVGVHLTFYLVNFNLGSNAIWEKAVADGHELGNHTVHHCYANGTGCVSGTFTTVAAELDDNTTFLKSKPGVTGVWSFASPYGDNGWAEGASQRFLLARGVSDANGGVLPKDGTTPYNLPCHISNTNETAVGGFNNISDDVRSKGTWRTVLMHSVDPAINDGGYQPVQLTEAVAAITYTKNLGDVWADTVTSIGAYWRAQKTVAEVTATTVGNDKVYTWTLPEHFPPGQYLRATVTGGKLKQCGTELVWDTHGYYEVNLDAGSLTISP